MKTRFGFVSNSSSSSFIIGIQNGLTFEEVLHQEFNQLFGLPNEDTVASSFVSHLEDAIIYALDSCKEDGTTLQNKEHMDAEIKSRNLYADINEQNYMNTLFAQGMYAVKMDIPDGGDGGSAIQSALRYSCCDLNYHSDKLVFKRMD